MLTGLGDLEIRDIYLKGEGNLTTAYCSGTVSIFFIENCLIMVLGLLISGSLLCSPSMSCIGLFENIGGLTLIFRLRIGLTSA